TSGGDSAIRLRTNDTPVEFEDRLQGMQRQCLEPESGDFVIYRRDGLVAYHLAVVVDDHEQGITDVVRGIDLMDSTPRQIWVQRCLGYRTPAYAHIPVAVHADGSKLSKLTGATGIPTDEVRPTLVAALAALRQAPASDLADASLESIWSWALTNWRMDALSGLGSVPELA
ncbi:MAG: glutamate--tRNA ligase family protein, partial [Pseudomonadota bacterium]